MNLQNFVNALRSFRFINVTISEDPMIFPCGVSRSGTTLLSALLDAHSQVFMGYEMDFKGVRRVSYIRNQLLKVQPDAKDLKHAGSILRKQGKIDLGKWISRCHRLGIEYDELLREIEAHENDHKDSLRGIVNKLLLIKRIVDFAKKKTGSSIGGFKVTNTLFNQYLSFFPHSKFVYILRDPRDVFCSLRERNFGLSLNSSCSTWNNGISNFEKFIKKHTNNGLIIRYEDLVENPNDTISHILKKLGLTFEENVLSFYDGKSKILKSSHPNATRLKKGFFCTSVNRYKDDLLRNEADIIEELCRKYMEKYNYSFSRKSLNKKVINLNKVIHFKIDSSVVNQKKVLFRRKKKYKRDEYLNLLSPYIEKNYEILRHIDYVRGKSINDRRVMIIRHDVDHDHLTAMKIAKWEHDHNIRSTFCLLHTAWYYGKMHGNTIQHTKDLVDCATYIASMGHEINFHNNLIVTALKFGINPVDLLNKELDFFSSIGIKIKGTSTHGDALCRELNFRNWELFTECCDDRFGGPRVLSYIGNIRKYEIKLGEYSMYDFGLEYEAYDISKDIYHTDSGGNLRIRNNTIGRRNFGRGNKAGSVVGVLTHPIWWKF
jgi:hypothetical protein